MSTPPVHQDTAQPVHQDQRRTSAGGHGSIISILNVVLVAALVFGGWSLLQLSPWNATARRGAPAPSTVQWSNVNPFGVNTFLSGEVEPWKRDRTMAMVSEAGVGWIRQGFAWSEIEPEDDVYWDAKYQQDAWAKFDEIVALAERYGVRIIARLDHTPSWARRAGSDYGAPPSDPEDFGDFVYEFVSRYRGRIDFVQIWNEPNLAREWGGEIDPEGYARLLSIAAQRAREANPHIVILSAPMAMTTENSGRAMDEFSYWQALYDHGVSASFDIISANAYGLDDHFAAEPDPAVLNVRRVELLRDLAVRNGDGHKAIWFNEFGWNASPEDFSADELIWARVDEDKQAQWTADGIDYADASWDWFGVASIWYFRQVGNISPDQSDYYFRMVDLEFTPRDVYRLVQESASDLRVAGVGEYGELEPPIKPYGSWSVVRDASTTDDGHYIVGQDGDSLTVHFEGSALDLNVVGGESHGSISVAVHAGTQIDGASSRAQVLPLDSVEDHLRITSTTIEHPSLAASGTHTAVITVEEGSQLALDGISVHYERSYRNVAVSAALAAAALIGSVGLRRQAVRPT